MAQAKQNEPGSDGSDKAPTAIDAGTPDYVVKVPFGGGVGVLVGDVILTAAHCVNYREVGAWGLGGTHFEDIETRQGSFKLAVLAVEPVSDIAVLGSTAGDELEEDTEAFQKFRGTTRPLPLARSPIQFGVRLTVSIRNDDGTWVKGISTACRDDLSVIPFQTEKLIEKGASGGPVLNERGELVGLVSITQVETGMPVLLCPRPLHALPVWVCNKFLNEEVDE